MSKDRERHSDEGSFCVSIHLKFKIFDAFTSVHYFSWCMVLLTQLISSVSVSSKHTDLVAFVAT